MLFLSIISLAQLEYFQKYPNFTGLRFENAYNILLALTSLRILIIKLRNPTSKVRNLYKTKELS